MGTPPQAVVRAAQPCLPSCSSLVPLPQHRRTTSGLAEEHPGALLPPPADKPKPLWFVPSGAATKENCNVEGEEVLAGKKEVFESPTSEIFVPEGQGTDICIFFAPPQPQEWQLGKGVSYNSKSCSEGCCFYTPASSKRVQEIEAEVEKNLPTWFRNPAGGCDDVPSSTTTSRLILNKDNNDSGDQAALCVKSAGKDTFELLTGETTSCKGKCCVFNCKSCKAPES